MRSRRASPAARAMSRGDRPTNRTASISPDVDDPGARNVRFDELVAAYGEAADAAGRRRRGPPGRRDDLRHAQCEGRDLRHRGAVRAARVPLPLMISGTITDPSGRTLSGQTPEAFWHSIRHARPFSVGLNCALGARALRPHLQELARVADVPVSIYPNAGLPNEFGGYDETAAETSAALRAFAADGLVNIVGGCCGTTPAHVRAIADGRRRDAAGHPGRAPADQAVRARAGGHPAARQRLRQRRRADERHRLAGVRAR